MLIHKSQVVAPMGFNLWLADLEQMCRRVCDFTWHAYFWASEEEHRNNNIVEYCKI